MMGIDSVQYHRATVLDRGDDHPGQALAYYASRGETPLRWGGRGADALGLFGAVAGDQYDAVYGVGGAADPATGERLVHTRRPGTELVVSAHKSVAELGVIGRAEDMHRIMDAERDATLAYLDDLTQRMGGRRGSAARRSATHGLLYATTRHATSRAGDPCPHDHVLVANLVLMADEAGGWKAADTALWREHLHAATMVGRLAAARKAVELGYAIVPDHGPSGRLGHWAIAGVPSEVMEVHSKRAAEIEAEVARRGHDSYQARNVAARATRDPKRHTRVGELLPR
jgi:conjugative relaxase-like TrwC/TraI family protein